MSRNKTTQRRHPRPATSVFELSEFPDMRMFMSSALRYSLARKSYAPGYFLTYLEEHLDEFSQLSRDIFHDDLMEFIKAYQWDEATSLDPVIRQSLKQATRIVFKIQEKS